MKILSEARYQGWVALEYESAEDPWVACAAASQGVGTAVEGGELAGAGGFNGLSCSRRAWIVAFVGAYFAVLLGIAWVTGRHAGNAAYFLGNRASPWYVVAFGLIGDSLSGATFISVPGRVRDNDFAYLQVVLGYVAGNVVIAHVLLPLYYRLQVTSIYSYRSIGWARWRRRWDRFRFWCRGCWGRRRGFIWRPAWRRGSCLMPGACRLPSVFRASSWLILVYTYRGGIKTLVWTDTFQSTFLLLGLVLSILAIAWDLGLSAGGVVAAVQSSPHSRIFFWEWAPANNFWTFHRRNLLPSG